MTYYPGSPMEKAYRDADLEVDLFWSGDNTTWADIEQLVQESNDRVRKRIYAAQEETEVICKK